MVNGDREIDEQAGRAARRKAFVALAIAALVIGALVYWRPSGLDLWIKAAHVIAVISWMAGLLYLPRLFIYHTDAPPGSDRSETFKVMEGRLLGVIMRPAMIATWLLGLWLAYSSFGFAAGWLWAKILAVVLLTGVHDRFARAVRSFAADERTHSARYWRLMNEVPTALMIVIVVLVIVKPF
ncbi:protoporphyrinogen oxidase HemJ [Pararhizobium haloflavum]|uniref:protoporphyrinogen oxidase HemJ n=1 Tax=Pararhizobium haloflavum TaxID=2037914 RepID=UPI000C18FAA0|nr:protoporphyrinogen oxidase HemJ [Pararhizobium haloflavum]